MDIEKQRKYIIESLSPLISNKVALLEVPYYFNIGDILIWKGELAFLSKIGCKIVYSTSSYNYDAKKKMNKDITILLQGGGNWGDIWTEPQNFRRKIIEQYPDNNIIVFPQTICYSNEVSLLSDAKFFSMYPNVTICARDARSYHILQTYFKKNKSLLLPDMAIFIDVDKNILQRKGEKILFAKRKDKEASCDRNYSFIPKEAETHDWPTYEGMNVVTSTLTRMTKILSGIDCLFHTNMAKRYIDYYWLNKRMPMIYKIGEDFLRKYHMIYTTRLHIGILGMLMGKKIILLDNNYGKLSSFYETWLKDMEEVRLFDNKVQG